MKLGIDFGTTRIVVAAADRGNYPVVAFEMADGSAHDWYPSLIAARGEERRFGWEAWEAQGEPGWTVVRSVKRVLEGAGLGTPVQIGPQTVPVVEALCGLALGLKRHLLERSSLPITPGERIEAMLGVPANANSKQRFLTVEAFRLAGFEVLGLLNEPSAASVEYGHRQRRGGVAKGTLLVYDLGGGTLDASLVAVDGQRHMVLASDGISTLGGDDFDEALAELALDEVGVGATEREGLSQAQAFRLQEECRAKKEALNPNTRKITIDLESVQTGWGTVAVPVSAYYERCRPLVDETLHTLDDLLSAHGFGATDGEDGTTGRGLEAVYVTGGGSELPLVTRMLRERFGRKVKRSAYTRSATAIGLAIQADAEAGYVLRERFHRTFGVWREAESGKVVVFDPIFPKGMALPALNEPALVRQREYRPVHNIGHFRYLECGERDADGQPQGEITVWDEILFPFDPDLEGMSDLSRVAVSRCRCCEDQRIDESYRCDAQGSVIVTIRNGSSGHERQYRLGRWASNGERPLVPGKEKRARRVQKANPPR